MPTGYTNVVGDGTVADLATFALRCARAFGALVRMRDDPQDAPIPERFEPSPYYRDALLAAKEKLAAVLALTPAEIETCCVADYEQALATAHKYAAERNETRRRYEAMIENVEAWTPPTLDHAPLKAFMLEQLRESIDIDCASLERMPEEVVARLAPGEWHAKQLQAAADAVAYNEKHWREEQARAEKTNAWIAALRNSLRPENEEHS